ncbi:MAG: hypothetical protein LJE95_13800 [Acidobacteria bacterium]|nr:hypothetical protein [Acidobacteriota bacterium]
MAGHVITFKTQERRVCAEPNEITVKEGDIVVFWNDTDETVEIAPDQDAFDRMTSAPTVFSVNPNGGLCKTVGGTLKAPAEGTYVELHPTVDDTPVLGCGGMGDHRGPGMQVNP